MASHERVRVRQPDGQEAWISIASDGRKAYLWLNGQRVALGDRAVIHTITALGAALADLWATPEADAASSADTP